MRLPQAQSHSPYAGTSCPLGQKRTSAEICRQRESNTADFQSVLPPTHAVPIDQHTKRITVSSSPIIVRSSRTHRTSLSQPWRAPALFGLQWRNPGIRFDDGLG
jgi:hypothetical protein